MFESPLEELVHDQILKRLARGATITPQVEVPTLCGTFRLDLMIVAENRRIGIECDGKDYHDQHRDEWRDAMILGDGRADEIIRLRGSDLTYHLDDCMYVLSRMQPAIFTDRHGLVLDRLASTTVRNAFIDECGAMATYGYIEESRAEDYIFVRRYPTEGRQFWRNYYRFAVKRGGGQLDELIAAWKRSDRGARVVIRPQRDEPAPQP